VSQQAFSQQLDGPGFHRALLAIALMQNDAAAAAKEIQWFEGREERYISLDLQASQALMLGQRRRASDLLNRAADQARRRKLQRPAAIPIEAAAADSFGDCQVEDSLQSVEAASEFRKIVDHKGATFGPRYPLAYVGLARAAVQAGDTNGAKKSYEDFFALWKDADPDIRVLIEAKREYASLN
jgi:hypothetical protein